MQPHADHDGYLTCRQADADVFVKSDYGEMKDLAKSFLTLLTAALVASITFSEKIVDLSHAGIWARLLMVPSWIAMNRDTDLESSSRTSAPTHFFRS